MVTLSELHYAFLNQLPRPITHLEGSLQPLFLTIHGGYQKTIQEPQLPGSAGVGYFFPIVFPQGNIDPGSFKGNFNALVFIKSVVKASSTPWTTQLVHTGCIQETCMKLAIWANLYSTVKAQVTQFNSQDGQICIDPNQSILLGNQPSRTSLQLFTYTHHLFFPVDFSPC
ncbi:hypothetical protein O181_031720 [Austropuccinia psidii MF-1]|uniref:Uncharacterized protein n=1 Tax=Austropuccinia psidii MF-1 TaxID=1389203 RepID=A0A9Q3CZN8_9BASI|nr:hypothetical protein [Austropuccinia psidii MF-1]